MLEGLSEYKGTSDGLCGGSAGTSRVNKQSASKIKKARIAMLYFQESRLLQCLPLILLRVVVFMTTRCSAASRACRQQPRNRRRVTRTNAILLLILFDFSIIQSQVVLEVR